MASSTPIILSSIQIMWTEGRRDRRVPSQLITPSNPRPHPRPIGSPTFLLHKVIHPTSSLQPTIRSPRRLLRPQLSVELDLWLARPG